MSEYDTEPVPGLPEKLPEGETLLWQGSPEAFSIARHAFLGGAVAVYFLALSAYAVMAGYADGLTGLAAWSRGVNALIIGMAALVLIALLGRLVERTTLYSITNKRVVMRVGIAIPMTLNIPFHRIEAADVKRYRDGSGDIALTPSQSLPVTYVHLWPHARAWHLGRPQPALRCLPDAQRAGEILVKAMLAAGVKGESHAPGTAKAPAPMHNIPNGQMPAAA